MVNFFIFSVNDKKSVVYGLLRRFTPRNDIIHKLVIARVAFATRGNLDMTTTIPNQNSSLRRPKACGNLVYSWPVIARLCKSCGNLGIEHYNSQTKFYDNL